MPCGGADFWWNWAANAGVALATFTAAAVALFGQAFRAKFFPPKLSLRLLSAEGEKAVVQWHEGDKIRKEDCRYYHLRVSNARRWSPANQVQVMLLQVQERAANGEFQITWTGAIPLGWRHQNLYPLSRTIGASADVDLCSVVKDKWLQIHPLVEPLNLEIRRRQASTFRLMLQAQGSEAESPIVQIQVAWDGQWHDGAQEMRKHLIVEAVEEQHESR